MTENNDFPPDRDKGRGYCFNCSTEFDIEMVSHPCPECGSERWSADPATASDWPTEGENP